jgi:hypothetical protein
MEQSRHAVKEDHSENADDQQRGAKYGYRQFDSHNRLERQDRVERSVRQPVFACAVKPDDPIQLPDVKT